MAPNEPVGLGVAATLQKLQTAVAALEMPSTMPQSEATALWMQLTSNLHSWLSQVDFRKMRKNSRRGLSLFKPCRVTLNKVGSNLEKKMAQLVHRAQTTGTDAEHWELLLL